MTSEACLSGDCGACKQLRDALRTLVERVRYYAPQMAREGDTDEAVQLLATLE